MLAAAGADGQSVLAARFRNLKHGLNDLARDYHVVILDPPPALGTISLAVMQAANALLVPLAATTPDICSTVAAPVDDGTGLVELDRPASRSITTPFV